MTADAYSTAEIVEYPVSRCARVNDVSGNRNDCAVSSGDLAAVRLLVESGADTFVTGLKDDAGIAEILKNGTFRSR